jgi:dolichol-phosphate mannosyltransferase
LNQLLVIIPTYNEIENIESIITAVLNLGINAHLLIVDDGSPDGTADKVRQMKNVYPESIHLLERATKSGLGTAYIAGFKWGLQNNYQFMAEMDADFSHPPPKLVELYNACRSGEADLTIGSRYIPGGGVINWPKSRLALSKGASLYVRMITGLPIQDPTAGFVCYRRAILEQINLDQIKFVGYAFQIEMKYAVKLLGFRLKEIPIIFPDRLKGKSKMNSSIVWEALLGVLYMKLFKSKNDYRK